MICYARLGLPVAIRKMQAEVKKVLTSESWMGHYNRLHYDGEWNVLPLRAPRGDAGKPFAELLNDDSFENTGLLKALPAIGRFLDGLLCEKQSVRLLNLRAGAIIKQHRDAELCFENGEARLHIPVFTHEKVEFFVDDERVNLKEGECWYINANLPHRVANMGNTDRIHLVVDCTLNDWLKRVFELSEKKCKANAQDRELQISIIRSLRMHRTEASSALADKLENELNHE
ncbi:aspartyl/asparaginyl beta-hydroxylase domain-containing protein [Mucilaginibacter ginsenosidivorans]|uniref:Aspartyl/asparaginyl beta-hydroxylase domain-containing protein n=1 Tax=Mucilaginibacter ginsenosidivorans TaxID=398053 RepID=A0A5B8USM7_9SPHI|nr:aspartyl/asparaginyl beta-hydroxylase domain-containing protein [Mucilaginibacter ginsenosidivorans]QEC62004.1 aspartyl/asparaginyl beta-hydroxylase domain-containing protein [Mucilaginibacter ginsenosidivorans]